MRRFKVTPGKIVALIVLILIIQIISLALSPTPDIFDESGRVFHPTLEQAFGRRGGMGEIIFIDEHEDSVTVFHMAPNWLGQPGSTISHFARKLQEEVLYSPISIATGAHDLSSSPESIEQNQQLIALRLASAYDLRDNPLSREFVYQRLNRRPLYGLSRDPAIHYLVINGQPVDYVIEYSVSTGRYRNTPLYFWYFSDFQFAEGDEIVISFG